MSPPIYTPDGSEVSEIVLPDGSTASEVIDPDGNVVFEAGPDIPDSGVARWTFDNGDTNSGTAVDIWGSNDGAIDGATTGVSGANQTYTTNEAYEFNGSGDNIDINSWSNIGFSNNDPFSIACWLNTDTTSSRQRVWGTEDGNSRGFILDVLSGGDMRFFLGNGGDTVATTTKSISTNTWHHATCTFDGSTATVYIDASNSASTSASYSGSNQNFHIATTDKLADYFDGVIDDVRIYDKGLTSTEVSNLFNNGSI